MNCPLCNRILQHITIDGKWHCGDCTGEAVQKESFKDGYNIASEERDKKYGKKESDNKLSYELDRYFIEAMAKRMSQNKGKYPPYNRQKPMDIESLKQALLRHTIEVMKGNYTDIEDYDHLQAIALNAQFIYYQLKNHVQNR